VSTRSIRVAGLAAGLMLGALALVLTTSVWSEAQPTPAPGPRIEIRGHKYSPATITVPVGTTIAWVNHDDEVHTVFSTTQAFTSPAIETDETYSHTFSKPGTYPYFCTLHPLMTGTVIVK
jgi:plastocyanin